MTTLDGTTQTGSFLIMSHRQRWPIQVRKAVHYCTELCQNKYDLMDNRNKFFFRLIIYVFACLLDWNLKQNKLTRLNFKQPYHGRTNLSWYRAPRSYLTQASLACLKFMLTLLKFQESILPSQMSQCSLLPILLEVVWLVKTKLHFEKFLPTFTFSL